MSIDIDKKDEGNYGYSKGKEKYKTTKEPYGDSDLFEKIVHEEINDDSGITYLLFKRSDDSRNKPYYFSEHRRLEKVEIFFSIFNNKPLVLAIHSGVPRYYSFSYLNNIRERTNLNTQGRQFPADQLLDKLIEENNNQNNVITYRLDKKPGDTYDSVSIVREEHPSFDKYKHTPNGQLESRTICIVYGGHKISLDKHSGYSKSGKLETLDGIKFCEVLVFYLKLSNKQSSKLPSYIELKLNETPCSTNEVNVSQIKTYYFEKADFIGVSWKQIENPELDETITYLLDSNESESYNDTSITVKNEPHPSFNIYTHTVYRDYRNRKAYLLFTDKDLKLIQNSYTKDNNRLKSLQHKPYLSITLFYYKARNTGVPEFLELEEKVTIDENSEHGISHGSDESLQSTATSPKIYLLERADNEGIIWKQIDYQDLKNTVTYRLECKNGQKDGYENNVVSNGFEKSFDVYTHTPKDVKKFGMFLYKWNVIFLQKNDDQPQITILESLETKKYCKISVYFTKLDNTEEHPFFIELFENKNGDESCTSVGSSSHRFFLQRVDPYGLHWKQIRKPNSLDKKITDRIIGEITSNNKNSIMVPLTEKDTYSIQLVKHHRTDGISEPNSSPKSTRPELKTLQGSSYQYCEHDFSVTKALKESNIERLRIFMKHIEIKIYDKHDNVKTINYNPVNDTSKKIQVFFYQRDSVPLLFIWEGNPYTSTKNDYFTKWKQAIEFETIDLNNKNHLERIKIKLDDINAEFNEILLEQTSVDGYGIAFPTGKQTPSAFSTSRVTVIRESSQEKYHKLTHSTNNKSSIGKVLFRRKELQNDTGTKLSQVLTEELKSATVVSVIVYYHKTDREYKKPLLLGFAKLVSRNTIQNTDLFYQRQSIDSDLKWTKIILSEDLRKLRQDPGLSDKINNIRYNIGNSVKIMIDTQHGEGCSGCGTYNVELIPNTNGRGGHEPVDSGQITVTQNSSTTTQHTGYRCFTHQIPDLRSSTVSEGSANNLYVSGLKLYICEKIYLNTNVPIYYDPNQNEVKVYFYGNNGGTSIENLDKVPLLAEYNGNHYKPSSRDGYFKIWDKVEVTTQKVGGHNISGKTLQQVLDEINKELNTIELDRTGSTGVYKYGIKPPDSEAGNCASDTIIDEFCSRVGVEQDNKNDYKKLTHSTTNKGAIGWVFLSGKVIHGIDSARLAAKCNKVEVYYHTSDSSYSKPLLIHISSQTNECSNNWYYRRNVEGTDWKHDSEFSKYSSENSIRDQLNQINASMSVFLYLQIDKQEQYEILAKSGSETHGKKHEASIGIDKLQACSSYNPGKNYRCFKHEMAEYYNQNKAVIKHALQTQEQPTLELKITLVGNILILESSDGSSLPTQLTYGPTEQRTNSNAYVYFFEPSGETDKVPLLFMFDDQFYGPISKDLFFEKWKKYTIDTLTGATVHNIKTTLNQITRLLNLIDLEQTSNAYGDIEPPSGLSHRPLGANKRVTVTRNMENGQDYPAITHSTADTGCVGSVKHGDHELEIVGNQGVSSTKWSQAIEAELKSGTKAIDIYNELTVYYHKSDSACENPLLIKISGSSGGSHSRVEDLYYERAEKDYKFKWKKVGVEELLKSKDDSWLAHKINRIYNAVNEKVAIPLGQSPSFDHNVLNAVQDRGQETSSSAGVGAGAKANMDEQDQGIKGERGPSQPSTSEAHTDDHSSGSGHSTNSTIDGSRIPVDAGGDGKEQGTPPGEEQHVEHQNGTQVPEASVQESHHNDPAPSHTITALGSTKPVGAGSPNGNGANTSRTSETGSAATSAAGGSGADNGTEDVLQKIWKQIVENPKISGGVGGSVAGVGVMATVGGVVYKKCIVGGAVAAGKAAAKVAASAASGM